MENECKRKGGLRRLCYDEEREIDGEGYKKVKDYNKNGKRKRGECSFGGEKG